jgi:phage terminase small subunit
VTDKHQRFVEEYQIDHNATQAAIRAGYSPRSAKVTGCRLLTDANVIAALELARAKTAERSGITKDRVLAELALLAFSDVGHYKIDDSGNVELAENAPKHARRAISSVKRKVYVDKDGNSTTEVEFRLWDKPGPLKLAGNHVGLFFGKPDIDLSSLPDDVFELLKKQLNMH